MKYITTRINKNKKHWITTNDLKFSTPVESALWQLRLWRDRPTDALVGNGVGLMSPRLKKAAQHARWMSDGPARTEAWNNILPNTTTHT